MRLPGIAFVVLGAVFLVNDSTGCEQKNILKSVTDGNNAVWALDSDGNVRINGGHVSWGNVADFVFDQNNHVVFLYKNGFLDRSKAPHGSGGWEALSKNVTKFMIDSNNAVWALDSDGNVRINGGHVSWGNVADFVFDQNNHVVFLYKNGFLDRSKAPHGSGGWEALSKNVTKFMIDSNNAVWALDSDGNVRINGGHVSWGNVADFVFDQNNHVVFLYKNGFLDRSKAPHGSGGWEALSKNVTKFMIDSNNAVWALDSDGNVRINGGHVSWGNVADFVFDQNNHVVFLYKNGFLDRSKAPHGSGGWEAINPAKQAFMLFNPFRAVKNRSFLIGIEVPVNSWKTERRILRIYNLATQAPNVDLNNHDWAIRLSGQTNSFTFLYTSDIHYPPLNIPGIQIPNELKNRIILYPVGWRISLDPSNIRGILKGSSDGIYGDFVIETTGSLGIETPSQFVTKAGQQIPVPRGDNDRGDGPLGWEYKTWDRPFDGVRQPRRDDLKGCPELMRANLAGVVNLYCFLRKKQHPFKLKANVSLANGSANLKSVEVSLVDPKNPSIAKHFVKCPEDFKKAMRNGLDWDYAIDASGPGAGIIQDIVEAVVQPENRIRNLSGSTYQFRLSN